MSSAIALAFPWALAAFVILPAIWWLLRVTPPPPKKVIYPSLRFLADLTRREETPAQTPLWLMILRLILAGLVILALAGPTLNPVHSSGARGPLLMLVDDTFSAAPDWADRLRQMDQQLAGAERDQRPVLLATTAKSMDVSAFGPKPASEVRNILRALVPKPWGADRAATAKRLGGIAGATAPIETFWMSDGVDDPGSASLNRLLGSLGPISIAHGRSNDSLALMLDMTNQQLAVKILRSAPEAERQVGLRLIGDGGLLINRQDVTLPANIASVPVKIEVPVDLANRLQRIELVMGEGSATAASAGHVALLDERNRRRPVALVSGGAFEAAQWLLSDLFYLERALSPYADVSIGTLEDALVRKPAVIVLADIGHIGGEAASHLAQFILDGGSVLRFAGPNLASESDASLGLDQPRADMPAFLPVPLRQGDRALGGAMTWDRPGHIAPFDADSPFAGLTVPEDVTISRQVLAEPGNDPSVRIWARLDDGTPLVTAQRQGQGWLALVHVTATPEWSNLALSGLYVDMLRRIMTMSRAASGGGAAAELSGLLKPTALMDAYGNLGQATLTAEAVDAQTLPTTQPEPRHPPGYYGEDARRRALNAIPADTKWTGLVSPQGAAQINASAESEIDLAPYLFLTGLILLLIDLLATLGIGGHLRRTISAVLILLALTMGLAPDRFSRAQAAPITKSAAANDARLAFVRSGNSQVDSLSQAGLQGLSDVLSRRTAFEPAEPVGVDIEQDEIVFYPLLYWPVLSSTQPLSQNTAAKVNAYMKGGGLILFDTRDGGNVAGIEQPAQLKLRQLLSALDVPPLVRMPSDHVLSKTFYLMQSFPGRWRDGTIWVQATQQKRDTTERRNTMRGAVATNDGVSPVVIGAQDWAAAWAVDEHGNPMAMLIPDDGDQRELAYRFGVNLVMYALTGNYKSDQVHVPALLERLGQ